MPLEILEGPHIKPMRSRSYDLAALSGKPSLARTVSLGDTEE